MKEVQRPFPAKPEWLKKRISCGNSYDKVMTLLKDSCLHTVCEEANCPNLGECFSQGTATFMIMGNRCTRNCTFCAVIHDRPEPLDRKEPEAVASAIKRLGLKYAVITSVTRDDLPDGGASHFAATIRAIRQQNPRTAIEVLIPDFQGSREALKTVLEAHPDILNHNVETVPSLYKQVRPQADYRQSLNVLLQAHRDGGTKATKSGIMLGLGEKPEEVLTVLEDLLEVGCRNLTIGQYLAPSFMHHQVHRYIHPDEFAKWEATAYESGFEAVASGPFVRSSYHASEMFNSKETRSTF